LGVPGLGDADRGVNAGGVCYWFAARDEAAAESMADALAAFGFGEVAACPTRRRHFLEGGMGWELAALDDNRYPPGNTGRQQELAVIRHARAIARAHGGFAAGSVTGGGQAFVRHWGPGPPPVLRQNPGSRPPVPPVPEVTAPPPGNLALAPDAQLLRPLSLDGLDAVAWSDFYGTGANPVPAEIARLAGARDDRDWGEHLLELLQSIMPNGTCRPDTGPAVSIVAGLLLGDALPPARRCSIYWVLTEAASRYADDMITGADITAATGRPPRPRTSSGPDRYATPSARSSQTCWPDGTSNRPPTASPWLPSRPSTPLTARSWPAASPPRRQDSAAPRWATARGSPASSSPTRFRRRRKLPPR
jgi:hypothetical protein